jgi:flagellar hook assembly protein FlgD
VKAKVDGKTVDLIPFKGDPQFWWDGKDESKLYRWEEIKTVNASSLNSSYSAVRLRIGVSVRGSVEGSNES